MERHSRLHAAVIANDIEACEQLMDGNKHKLLPKRDITLRTALHMACERGQRDIATLLLNHTNERQILLAMRDVDGMTPLHHACVKRNPELVLLLLKYGTDDLITSKNRLGRNPIDTAIASGHLGISVLLLGRLPCHEWTDWILSSRSVYDGCAWHKAIRRGYNEFVIGFLEFLGDRACRVVRDAERKTGKTSLHLAAEYGHDRMFIVMRKIAPWLDDVGDYNGDTPYTLALRNKCAGVLLELWNDV